MKFEKENREAITSIVVFVISVALCIYSCMIQIKNEGYLQSARIFPQIISSLMVLLSTLYMVSSLRKSNGLTFNRFCACTKNFFAAGSTRRIASAIALVGIYIFLGVQKGRFYICSLIFMIVSLFIYTKRVKPLTIVFSSAAFVGFCWLLFYKIFAIQLV